MGHASYLSASFRRGEPVVRWRYLMRAGLAAMLVNVLGSATNVGADSLKSGWPILGSSGPESGVHARLDQKLNDRARNAQGGTSRVIIIQVKSGSSAAE